MLIIKNTAGERFCPLSLLLVLFFCMLKPGATPWSQVSQTYECQFAFWLCKSDTSIHLCQAMVQSTDFSNVQWQLPFSDALCAHGSMNVYAHAQPCLSGMDINTVLKISCCQAYWRASRLWKDRHLLTDLYSPLLCTVGNLRQPFKAQW